MKVNTSNPNKQREFTQFLKDLDFDATFTNQDLREIDSDPVSVVVHKASQFDEPVLVEDTSFDVDGEDLGVNIKWKLDRVADLIGKRATWTILIGINDGNQVSVFRGQVFGTISEKRGEGFGFDPYFVPDGCTKTLGEDKPKDVSARWLALLAMKNGQVFSRNEFLKEWDGKFQD